MPSVLLRLLFVSRRTIRSGAKICIRMKVFILLLNAHEQQENDFVSRWT